MIEVCSYRALGYLLLSERNIWNDDLSKDFTNLSDFASTFTLDEKSRETWKRYMTFRANRGRLPYFHMIELVTGGTPLGPSVISSLFELTTDDGSSHRLIKIGRAHV